MLKPDSTTTKLIGSGFSSSQGSRGRDLGGIDNYYNLLLYNAAATSVACYFMLYMNYWLLQTKA